MAHPVGTARCTFSKTLLERILIGNLMSLASFGISLLRSADAYIVLSRMGQRQSLLALGPAHTVINNPFVTFSPFIFFHLDPYIDDEP